MRFAWVIALGFLFAPAAGMAQSRSETWELMGIRLGMTEQDVRKLMPEAECEQFKDGQTALCWNENRTLAGKAATLSVKFLDGRVIRVSVRDIRIAEAKAAIDVLAGRYGSPDGAGSVRADLGGGDNHGGRLLYKTPYWKDGNVEIFLNVSDWYSKKRDTTYSAVILQDTPAYSGLWLKKYKGESAANEI